MNKGMNIEIKSFGELDAGALYEILRLRAEVFVVEQQCAYQDVDGKDPMALHVMGREGGKLVAYTRIFEPGTYAGPASIGRVVVRKEARIKGYGKEIMQASLQALSDRCDDCEIEISAQSYLIQFYRDLGFVETGVPYLEDGIPHIRMLRK